MERGRGILAAIAYKSDIFFAPSFFALDIHSRYHYNTIVRYRPLNCRVDVAFGDVRRQIASF